MISKYNQEVQGILNLVLCAWLSTNVNANNNLMDVISFSFAFMPPMQAANITQETFQTSNLLSGFPNKVNVLSKFKSLYFIRVNNRNGIVANLDKNENRRNTFADMMLFKCYLLLKYAVYVNRRCGKITGICNKLMRLLCF